MTIDREGLTPQSHLARSDARSRTVRTFARRFAWLGGTLALSLPPAFARQAQQVPPPPSASSVTFSAIALGPGTCPDGSTPLTLPAQGCFPSDCTSFQNLDWGTGGAPVGVLSIPKFNPALGTLQAVQLTYKADFQGTLCADNTAASCSLAELNAAILTTAVPTGTNSPQVTGLAVVQLPGQATLTPMGFMLGASDGQNDCASPSGPQADGACPGTGDYIIAPFAQNYTTTPITLTGADLAPWINTGVGPADVKFDTTALGTVSGNFSFMISINLNSSAKVHFDVTYHYCPNVPPICNVIGNDDTQTDEGVPVEIDVLANDQDIDGFIDCTTLAIAPGLGPQHGTAIVPSGCATAPNCPDNTCRIIYTPNPGFCGVDQFSYVVNDDDGAQMTACTVTVTVNPVNEPPVALDDTATTPEGTPVLIDVTANDSDPDNATGCGDPLVVTNNGYNPFRNSADTAITITPPSCGGNAAAVFNAGRWQIRLNPPPGYCGPCTFTYQVRDTGTPALESNVATVTVTITPVNEPPVAVDDSASTNEGTPVLIDVTANDSDPDDATGCGDPLVVTNNGYNPFRNSANTAVNISAPSCGGTAAAVFNGGRWQIRLSPPAGFCGPCTFTYQVRDTGTPALESNVATVTVDVLPVNEPPVALDDSATTPEGTPVNIDVTVNDSDPDGATGCGDPLVVTNNGYNPFSAPGSIGTPSCGGTVAAVFTNGRWRLRFTPPAGFCGQCTFTYQVRDTGTPALGSNAATVTVTVTPVNEPPVALDDSATTPEGTAIDIDVTANDSDPDGATGCGDPLVVTNGSYNPFSAPGSIGTTSCGGTVAAVFTNGRWRLRFTPPAGFCGQCTFTYQVRDTGTPALGSNAATVTVTVDPVNEPPVALDDAIRTTEGTPVLIDVTANDSDPDGATGCGAPLVVTNGSYNPYATPGSIGTTSCGATVSAVFNGGRWKLRFDPPAGFCGQCTFTYQVRDTGTPALGSNLATVTVSVNPVNEPPVAQDDSASTTQGTPVLVDVGQNDSDPDAITGCGDPLVFTDPAYNPFGARGMIGTPSCGGTAAAVFNGGRWQIRFDPPAGFCGVCTFTYKVRDTGSPALASNQATVTVDVSSPNNPPVAVDDFATTPEGVSVHINLIANDSDPDSLPCGFPLDPDSVTIVTPPDPNCGTVSGLVGGRVDFLPATGFCGVCTFTYQVCDQDPTTPLCDTALVTVTVEPVNECPIAEDDSAETYVDQPVVIDVCTNDHDADDGSCGGALDCTTVVVVTQPDCGGSATALGDGTIRFVPPVGFVGTCCFTYAVSDDNVPPCVSNAALVCVDVLEPPCETENRRAPGSLLLYPEFDNRDGIVSIFTVTNTGSREIQVEFVYREEGSCQEFNRKEDLTPRDTLSLITNFHNPNQDRGFLYVFAQCPQTNKAVAYDKLIGQVLTVDGLESFSYGINAVSFRGIGGTDMDSVCTTMALTDLNGNGKRDLDGVEYAMAPDEILIPRFFAQDEGLRSELILISLSGGAHFTTTLDLLIFNDNEEQFSRELSFHCWDRRPLSEISAVFSRSFLTAATNHDPDEVLGDTTREAGWFRIDGDVAVSTAASIADPAFYAVLVEMTEPDHYVADLPFEFCSQGNGMLYPTGTLGN
ncbi:MAG: tandem-95 repeat protein [Planctomycetes bacterium]|nr:tandem-95 repeat protein [Planctomycetota bacterium]